MECMLVSRIHLKIKLRCSTFRLFSEAFGREGLVDRLERRVGVFERSVDELEHATAYSRASSNHCGEVA